MKLYTVSILLSFLFASFIVLDAQIYLGGNDIGIVPQPNRVVTSTGSFEINKTTQIVVENPNEEVFALIRQLNGKFAKTFGFELPIVFKPITSNYISIVIDTSIQLNWEGYDLTIVESSINITSKTAQGAFYALQTLFQLLPFQIEGDSVVDVAWKVPCITVSDYPRFPYRGLLIDVSRHYFTVDFIKQQLDLMALYKLNTFHWHLTDDQGWRIEIKKYPKLTEIGARRIEADGTIYEGFYTQEEIKEVVKYAKERFINVIPEIELPGHSLAALAAYPEYSCNGGPFKVRNFWGVESNVYCPGNEQTFQFIDAILAEVVSLFPTDYIHIGGDECPKESWKNCSKCKERIIKEGLRDEYELQSYFIKRVEKMLQNKGKKMIGWDEILEGGLASSAIVMSWRGEEGGIEAARQNHNVIMTPNNYTYLNYYQGSSKVEPIQIKGLVTLKDVYEYDPIPILLEKDKHHFILGTQGNAWTEYIYNTEDFNYQVYPRLLAIAEVSWTMPENKNFDNFLYRLENQYPRLELHRINYHIPLPEGTINTVAFIDSAKIEFSTSRPMKMVYTLDGNDPTNESTTYSGPILLTETKDIKIRTVMLSGKMSPTRTIKVEKQKLQPSKSIITKTGLKVSKANGLFFNVRDLKKVNNWTDTVVTDIKLKFNYSEPSAVVFTGFLNISESDVYFFASEMDQLYLDGVLVINNDGDIKKNSRNDGSVALERGKHELKIIFLNTISGGFTTAKNDIKIMMRKANEDTYHEITPEMLSH